MELFRHFPRFWLQPHEEQLVPHDERNLYPTFSKDFEILDKELMPCFHELDNEALSKQNRYRWMYILLIFGGAMITILGAVQLAFPAVSWIGIIQALVAAIVTLATTILQRFKDHERYLNARLAAERLRGEYFLFLGRCGQYANEKERIRNLLQTVADINAKKEMI